MADSLPPVAPLRILIVDDEANIRLTLSMCLSANGHDLAAVGTVDEALAAVSREVFDLIFLDLRLGTENGLDIIPQLVAQNPWVRVIVITAYASVETAVEAMKRGASDYLPKPFEAAQVLHVTRKVAEQRQLERRLQSLRAALGELDAEADLPTTDPTMLSALELAHQAANSRATLIIAGEIGTGKVRLARAIHAWSERSAEPFAVVSCRPDVSHALETELFGSHAADGATISGKLEFCDGGTLVLDEVADLPLHLQPAILRLARDKEFERPDETVRHRSNLRLLATTSVNLDQAVERGRFRGDLLLALNVVQINLPPLRDRPNDIPFLAEHFLAYFSRQAGVDIGGFTPEAAYVLKQHQWPGNVRELRNVVERAVLVCKTNLIGVQHLPSNLLNSPLNLSIGDLVPLSSVEELHIRRVVASSRSLRQAAFILGINSGTVVRRLKRYGNNDDQPEA